MEAITRRDSVFTDSYEETNKIDDICVNIAFKNLNEVPKAITRQFSKCATTLDLSQNYLTDLRSIESFTKLHTLIVDGNNLSSFIALNYVPNLRMLSVNDNNIENLSVFIKRLSEDCPRLKCLSMMKNTAAPSYFNGGTKEQNADYRAFVISHFPLLENLDGNMVQQNEKIEAYQVYGRRWKISKKRHGSVISSS